MEIKVKSMTRLGKSVAVVAVGAVIAALATGCASGGGTAPTGGASASDGGSGGGAVTLEFWSFYQGSEAAFVDKWVKDYNASHKDVQIHHTVVSQSDYTTTLIPTALANGSAPDILYVEPSTFTKYAEAGALADLDPYYTDKLKSDILPAVLDSATYGGKLLALPMELETLGLFYDKNLLASERITPPKTWTELKSAAQKLTTHSRFGLALPVEDTGYTLFNFYPFMWMAGADVTDGKGKYTVDTPQMADALDFWGSFRQSGSSPSSLQIGPWDVGNIATGVAAMQESGSYAIKATETDYKKAPIAAEALPAPDGGKSITVAGGQKLAVNAASKHVKEAADFIFSGFGSDDISVASGWVTEAKFAYPARQSVIDANKDVFTQGLRATFTDFYDTARPEPSYPAVVTEALRTALQDVVFGGMSGTDAAKKAQTAIDAG
jgi:ABC-type glycerol-3-phosphate transport system substrate-binding protein